MAIDYTALKNELNNDPQTYGYAALITGGDDVGLAALLNKVRDGTDGEAAITVRRPDIAPFEILEQIDTRDLKASPTALEGAYLSGLFAQRTIRLVNDDGSNTRVIGNLSRLISSNTNGSQTRLTTVASRNGSRAEQLFGPNTVVSYTDIGIALRQTP